MIGPVEAGGAAPPPVIPTFKQSSCVLQNRTFCWDYFDSHWSSLFGPALNQHIFMTVVAIVIGFAIAFSAAVCAHFLNFLVKPITFVTSLLYTIPSLAAFTILVKYTGIGYLTVEIPLVAYTLLILFTNTLAGLAGVSPEVLDAARGAGLTRWQVLRKVELPLALPTIVAGIRIATVTVISLATIAAFGLIPKGLGQPIYDGVGRNLKTEFFAGAVLCILLALVADALLVGSQRVLTPWARRRR